MGAPPLWTTERDDALRALINSGVSYRQAACQLAEDFKMNISRNAAIGRGSRLGIKPPVKAIRRVEQSAVKRRSKRTSRPRPDFVISARTEPRPTRMEVEMRCAAIEPRNIEIGDLNDCDCRYPYGDSAPYLFCGHPKIAGSSYCLGHSQLISRQIDERHSTPQAVAGVLRANACGRAVICVVNEREEAAI